ncbi:DUF695 domain-containing protein, partial [Oleiphilus sp. HI0128]
EPSYQVIHREDMGAKVYAAVNTTLATFEDEPRKLYAWQLSLILKLDTEDEQGLTLPEEAKEIEPFCQQLDVDLRAGGNAVPLARITWNKTRELLFRVYNPVQADELIKSIIEADTTPRPFSYTIDPDEDWKMSEVYLKSFR